MQQRQGCLSPRRDVSFPLRDLDWFGCSVASQLPEISKKNRGSKHQTSPKRLSVSSAGETSDECEAAACQASNGEASHGFRDAPPVVPRTSLRVLLNVTSGNVDPSDDPPPVSYTLLKGNLFKNRWPKFKSGELGLVPCQTWQNVNGRG